LAAVERTLAAPAEAVGRDIGEAPAHRHALAGRALLHDVPAARAAELAREVLLYGVAPEDVPGIERGVVDAQGRAVERARQDPDVLDGASVERPNEMNFALAFVRLAVVEMHGRAEHPVADQPAIEAHLVGAIGGRAVADEAADKTGGVGHGEFLSADLLTPPHLTRLGKIAMPAGHDRTRAAR